MVVLRPSRLAVDGVAKAPLGARPVMTATADRGGRRRPGDISRRLAVYPGERASGVPEIRRTPSPVVSSVALYGTTRSDNAVQERLR